MTSGVAFSVLQGTTAPDADSDASGSKRTVCRAMLLNRCNRPIHHVLTQT